MKPIVLGELLGLLVKLALGALVDAHRGRLDDLFLGRHDGQDPDAIASGLFLQLGLTRNDGVSQFLGHARFLAAAHSHRVLITLDLKNAYGEASRTVCRGAVRAQVPTMESGLAQLWGSGAHVVYVEHGPGQWEPHEVGDGLWQGSCEASAMLCIGMQEALEPVIADLASQGIRGDLLKCIGDMLLSVNPSDLQIVWPALEAALATAGLTLVPSKCAAHVPAAMEEDPRITTFVQQRFDGLPLIGTAADGHLESFLGPFALGVEPTKARLDRALAPINKIKVMAQATLPKHVLQPSWCLLSQCAAHALDFDLRVHTPRVITPFAQILTHAVDRCAARILGRAELDVTARNQLLLPVAEGGCGSPDLPLMAPAARLSAALQVRPAVARSPCLRLVRASS